MADTIEDLVRADHEAINAHYNDLESMAAQFVVGDNIYCARVEKTAIQVRYGTVENIVYKSGEILFSVAPLDSNNPSFTISTRNWNCYETEQDCLDYLHSVFAAQSEPTIDGSETTNDGNR